MSRERRHRCPAQGCPVLVPNSMLMCRPHWYALPQELRSAIWEAYRNGDRVRHRAFMVEAIRFLLRKRGAGAES